MSVAEAPPMFRYLLLVFIIVVFILVYALIGRALTAAVSLTGSILTNETNQLAQTLGVNESTAYQYTGFNTSAWENAVSIDTFFATYAPLIVAIVLFIALIFTRRR